MQRLRLDNYYLISYFRESSLYSNQAKPRRGKEKNLPSSGLFHGGDEHDVQAITLRTDEKGMANFILIAKGIWYISLIHMKKIDDPNADFQSDWATVTFEIR